jgi:hypothetical protein
VGRGHDTCALCSGPKALRQPRPIEGTCETCGKRVCKKHLDWLNGWICKRCKRKAAVAAAPQRQEV